MTRKNKQKIYNQQQKKKRGRNKKTRNKRKTTRERENERKMYLKLVTCWIVHVQRSIKH